MRRGSAEYAADDGFILNKSHFRILGMRRNNLKCKIVSLQMPCVVEKINPAYYLFLPQYFCSPFTIPKTPSNAQSLTKSSSQDLQANRQCNHLMRLLATFTIRMLALLVFACTIGVIA